MYEFLRNTDSDEARKALTQLLTAHRVPFQKWDAKQGTKTVEQLLQELRNGDCTLVERVNNGNTELIRQLKSVCIIIVGDIDGKPYVLQETKQIRDGTTNMKKPSVYSMKEKASTIDENGQLRKETSIEAAARGIQEELGISAQEQGTLIQMSASFFIEGETDGYPGLPREKTEDVFVFSLKTDFLKREGYITDEPTKTLYFNWITMEEYLTYMNKRIDDGSEKHAQILEQLNHHMQAILN